MADTVFSAFESSKLAGNRYNFAIKKCNWLIEFNDVKAVNNKFEVHVQINWILDLADAFLVEEELSLIILNYDILLDDFFKWLESLERFDAEKLNCHVEPSWLKKRAI